MSDEDINTAIKKPDTRKLNLLIANATNQKTGNMTRIVTIFFLHGYVNDHALYILQVIGRLPENLGPGDDSHFSHYHLVIYSPTGRPAAYFRDPDHPSPMKRKAIPLLTMNTATKIL